MTKDPRAMAELCVDFVCWSRGAPVRLRDVLEHVDGTRVRIEQSDGEYLVCRSSKLIGFNGAIRVVPIEDVRSGVWRPVEKATLAPIPILRERPKNRR